MLSSLGLAVCFVISVAIVFALAFRAGGGRPADTIGRVLYDAEHPERTR